MADEFHASICSSMGWWNTINNTSSFNLPPSISCSTSLNLDSTNWAQPSFLPLEFNNQIQTSFVDSSLNDQALLPGFFEPVDLLKDMNIDNSVQQASWAKFNPYQLSRVSSLPKQQPSFSNNTSFCNPSANISTPPTETKKHGGDQPAPKKQRIATPSPLPTFKVRKEKLGDRITALQQLVSPFGKTDTASVLHEAIDYIKFLHGQVGALSTPYLTNAHQMQHNKDEGLQDLRSRGLCLVPISSTFAVASETSMDFWAPTYVFGKP